MPNIGIMCMDKDSDGKVTFSELSAYHPRMGKEAFDKADSNGDEDISHDEWYRFEDKQKMGRNRAKGTRYNK